MGFEKESDARGVLAVWPKRCSKYGLTEHPEKTRLVDFRAPHPGQTPGTFLFLGFTHDWGASRCGYQVVKRKTAQERLARTLQRIEQWCKRNRHQPMAIQH